MARVFTASKAFPPVAGLIRFAGAHPLVAAWIALSTGICVVLAFSGRNAGVPLGPWLVMFVVGILTAGLCIEIVTGDDSDDAGDA